MANEQIRTKAQLLEDFKGQQELQIKLRNLIVSFLAQVGQ